MDRKAFIAKIARAFTQTPVVVILGPPQSGKTHVAKRYAESIGQHDAENYFDLGALPDLQRLAAAHMALSQLSGLIILDEIQHFSQLFPILRALVDQPDNTRRFLILSSAAKSLLRQPLDSLFGRITYLAFGACTINEVSNHEQLWLRGGFPPSYLAASDEMSFAWRSDFTRAVVERYLPNIGVRLDAKIVMRFWTMLSYYHGELFNSSELARAMDLSHNTMQSYARALSHIFMIRELQPWHENISKRQVKARRVYFRDTGIYHQFLGIKQRSDLLMHPKLAASWKGMALEALIRHANASVDECFFWATQGNAQLDLLIVKDGKRLGFNIQYSGLPKVSRSLGIAQADLKLDAMTVIYPGEDDIKLTDKVLAMNLLRYISK